MTYGHDSVFSLRTVQHSIPGLNCRIWIRIESKNPTWFANLGWAVK
ncbi:uncharacterized protein METZ01_LOCUS80049, partial [marine metagenome]